MLKRLKPVLSVMLDIHTFRSLLISHVRVAIDKIMLRAKATDVTRVGADLSGV